MNSAKLKETIANIVKEESEYQIFFRKALEKAGKSIPSMSDEEKKAFFNKIDKTWDGKGEKNEGNAFGAAVVAAKKAGEDEFEVGGKTFKVEESVNEAGKLKVGKEDFSFLLKLTDKELVKRLGLIRKQQLINGKQYMDARSKGEDTSKIEKVGENLANQEKAVIHARIRIKESVNEGVSPTDMAKIKGAVEAASSFMNVGSELKKLGMKYTFATEPLPIYIIQPTPNNKVAIVNKKYATKPDFVVGDIAVGIMEGKLNEEEIKWNVVQNAIINFLKMNTKILDKRVQAKDTDGVKGGLKSIISGLTNAQRSLKLESVNEAGYTVKAQNPYQFVNGAYAVLTAYLRDEELGPKGKRELQDIIKSLEYMRKYFYFKMSESVNESQFKVGDTVIVTRKDGKEYTGKVEKLNPLKLRTSPSDTMVIPNAYIKDIVVESVNEGKFKKDDLVYNKRTKTIGIVRMGDDKYGEVKTDADGNVNVDELEIFNPFEFKYQTKAKAAPSTEREVNSRGLFNPFRQESVNEERDSNLFYVLYQKKDGKFSKPQAAGYTSREDAEKFAKSLNNHSTMILDKTDFSGVKGVKVTNESVNEGKKYDTLNDFEKVAKISDIFYLGSEAQFKRASKNDYYKVVGKKSDNSLIVTKGNSNKKYVIGADRYDEPIIVVNEESVNEQTLKQGTKLRYDKNNFVIDYVVDKEYKGSDGFPQYTLKVVKSNYPKKIKIGSTEEYESSELGGLMRNGVIKFIKNESVNEGRAFINAARKAKLEGKTEFEFNGKKYPITLKEGTLNEMNPQFNKKVKTLLDKELKDLRKGGGNHLFAVMHILMGALTDANFHSDSKKVPALFGSKAKYEGDPMAEKDLIQMYQYDLGTDIANICKWDGKDIVDAIGFYVSMTVGRPMGEKIENLIA